MTRVLVEVLDDRRVDVAALQRAQGVKGYLMQGRQHQIFAGPGAAAKIVDAMRRLMPDAPAASSGTRSVDSAAQTRERIKTRYATPSAALCVSWLMCLSRSSRSLSPPVSLRGWLIF